MPIIDDLRERLTSFFPQKSTLPPPRSQYGEGVRNYQDDMIVSKPAIVFHTCQAFFAFLAMACFASVASFQAKWKVGPSGLSGLSIFVSVVDLLLSLFLLLIPVLYEKYDKFNRLARALKEDRVAFILVGWGTITMFLISFITTISAWTQPGCKDPNKDPNASLGDGFKNGLSGWCDTKKAGAIFFWLATIFWVCSAVLTFLDWRSGKRLRDRAPRDPPFEHPNDPSGYAPSLAAGRDEEEDHDGPYRPAGGYAPPTSDPPRIPPIGGVGNSGAQSSPFSDEHRYQPASQPRQRMDAYGAFSDPAPTGYAGGGEVHSPNSPGVSRTMQYADPYAAVQASLGRSPGHSPGHEGTSTPPSYDYQGYR